MIIHILNIKELVQVREDNKRLVKGHEMNQLPTLKNAFLIFLKANV